MKHRYRPKNLEELERAWTARELHLVRKDVNFARGGSALAPYETFGQATPAVGGTVRNAAAGGAASSSSSSASAAHHPVYGPGDSDSARFYHEQGDVLHFFATDRPDAQAR